MPDEHRRLTSTVRDVIQAHLCPGVVEGVRDGAVVYATSDGLDAAVLTHDDQAVVLHLPGLDAARREGFRESWLATGQPLDMTDATVRLTQRDHIPLVVIGDAITWMSPEALRSPLTPSSVSGSARS